MEDGPQGITLPPPTLEPISRPSSTSTSASLPQLPGISSIASGNSATSSPQMRPANVPPPMYTGSSPAATTGGGGTNLPTCQNCTTSTTPLWRRDEFGSVLCNACGLFLKLHGRPRPISLKTDVIKSRNRVKAMNAGLSKRRQQQTQVQPQAFPVIEPNGIDAQHSLAAAATQAARRTSQKSANGHTEGSRSPVSRTATPSMYNPHAMPGYPPIDDAQFGSNTLAPFASPRPTSPHKTDAHLDGPQTHEQLLATNSSLKTRVSELEVINELFHEKLSQLEQDKANALRGQEISGQAEAQLRAQVDALTRSEAELRTQVEESHRLSNTLKRRLDELEVELREAKDGSPESGRAAKKLRVSDVVVTESDVSTPQSATT